MTDKPQSPSIHEIPLPTTGGIPARKGFDLQDHVAASYCIQMISETRIKEVWNEAHDDVTLIWQTGAEEEVEFIQVKSNEMDQLWSIALLCQRDSSAKTKEGTSIFERSLSRHACSEACRFRIVTSRDVKGELKALTHALDSPERNKADAELQELATKIADKIKDVRSPNGFDGPFWVSHTLWHVVHALDAVRTQNLVEFEKKLEKLGYLLLSDQKEEVYQKLVKKLWDAALAEQLEPKKIKRDDLLSWLSKTVEYMRRPASIAGERMKEKMKLANLPDDAIVSADEMRMRYRTQALMDQYSSPSLSSLVEAEVAARLSTLRARLDAGDYADDGPSFYRQCLDALEQLYNTSAAAQQLTLAFLHGCMFNMTDRCAHRFRRVAQ